MQLVMRLGLAGALCLLFVVQAAGAAVAKGGAPGATAVKCQNLGYTNYSTSAGGTPFGSEQACSAWVTAGNVLVFSPVTVDPPDWHFGTITQGSPGPVKAFTFTNRGTLNLSLSWLEYWDADQDRGATCILGVVSLAPGASCPALIRPRVDLTAGLHQAFVRLGYTAGRKESGVAKATYDFVIAKP